MGNTWCCLKLWVFYILFGRTFSKVIEHHSLTVSFLLVKLDIVRILPIFVRLFFIFPGSLA